MTTAFKIIASSPVMISAHLNWFVTVYGWRVTGSFILSIEELLAGHLSRYFAVQMAVELLGKVPVKSSIAEEQSSVADN
jgi:hypothetical protein